MKKEKITTNDLITLISIKHSIPEEDVKKTINALKIEILEQVSKDKEIEIRELGRFYKMKRKDRNRYNVVTDTTEFQEGKFDIGFKMSIKAKKELN